MVAKTDMGLVVHADLQRTARVRALMDYLIEIVEVHRELLRGG